QLDTNRNGLLDIHEAVNAFAILKGMSPGHGDQNVFTILQAFDKDGNGVITEADFVIAAYQNGYGHLGEMAARNTFRQLDTNRNGLLDIHEAVNAFAILKGMSPGMPTPFF
ncbi:unnamed protein product, partial [Brachionus calyciflorus]